MTTTSLKLLEDVREQVAAAAQAQGISAHAFMVAAVSDAAMKASQQRARFVAAPQHTLESSLGYEADGVHAWLQAKAAGRNAPQPLARAWRD